MVCLPEDIARRSRRGMATGGVCGESIGGEILPSKKLFAEKGKELFAWRSRWDSNPRASKG